MVETCDRPPEHWRESPRTPPFFALFMRGCANGWWGEGKPGKGIPGAEPVEVVCRVASGCNARFCCRSLLPTRRCAHSQGLTAPAPGTTMRAPRGALRASALSFISEDHGRTP